MNSPAIPLDEARRISDAWQSPDLSLASDDRPSPPAFPLEVLPDFWREWAGEAAGAKGAPVDYVVAGLLSVSAALVGNALWVRYADWKEPPILWFQLIGTPSSGKSPGLDPALSILDVIEREKNADFEEREREYLREKESAKVAYDAWLKDVKEAGERDIPAPQIPVKAQEPDVPTRRRVRLGDTTIEAVASILKTNPKGLLIVRDELAGWLESFNRYTSGSDRPFWLEAFGGRPYKVDRKGAAGTIDLPYLSCGILGGIQPDRLSPLLSRGQDDGLQVRFLSIWPNPVGIVRPTMITRQESAIGVLRHLANLSMTQNDQGGVEPSFISLSGEAEDTFHEWRERNHDPHQGGFLGGFRRKLPAYVLRLSLVLELLEWSLGGDPELPAAISKTAVSRSITLADEYLMPMAIRTYADVSKEQDEEDAATLARYLQRRRVTGFNARTLGRESGLPGMSSRKRRDKAIALLEEAGWIRLEPSPGPGRRALNYAVNPAVLPVRE